MSSWGYVRDGARRPISGNAVEVVREKTGLSYLADTDADGFYVVVAHFHDEDLLDVLRVTAGRVTIRIEARFNPLNAQSPRGTRVDFTGPSAVERQEMFAETVTRLSEAVGGPDMDECLLSRRTVVQMALLGAGAAALRPAVASAQSLEREHSLRDQDKGEDV